MLTTTTRTLSDTTASALILYISAQAGPVNRRISASGSAAKSSMGGAIAVDGAFFGHGFRGGSLWSLALILLAIIVIAVFWFPW